MPVSLAVALQHAREVPLRDTLVIRNFHTKVDEICGIILGRGWAGSTQLDPVWIEISHAYSRKESDRNHERILRKIPGIEILSPKNEREELQCIHHALQVAKQARSLLIFDHRGLITKLIHESHRELISQTRAVITITPSARTTIEQIGQLEVPVLPLYESYFKGDFESLATAESVADTIETRLGVNFRGKTILVFGYGRVGRSLAKLLKTRKAHVLIAEPDELKQWIAQDRGFCSIFKGKTPPCNILITATGRNPQSEPGESAITAEELVEIARASHDRKILCVNAGSGWLEFDKVGLDRLVEVGQVQRTITTLSTRYETFDVAVVELVAEGLPVNLRLGDGNPLRVMDLVQGTMLELSNYAVKNELTPGLHGFPRQVDKEIARHVQRIYGDNTRLLRGDRKWI
jgi:adenosylhomocysteinase